MKLLTKELEKQFLTTGNQRDVPDPLVVAKFWLDFGGPTWYAISYDKELTQFFGLVCNPMFKTNQWHQFTQEDLQYATGFAGATVQRDMYFEPVKVSELPELSDQKARESVFMFLEVERHGLLGVK